MSFMPLFALKAIKAQKTEQQIEVICYAQRDESLMKKGANIRVILLMSYS